MVPRRFRDFDAWSVPCGVLHVRVLDDGRWVILAGDPPVKLDNHHLDGRPHMHLGGWSSEQRVVLRPDLGWREAAEAVTGHLAKQGFIDIERLAEELR